MADLPNEIWIDIILQLEPADLNGWRQSYRQFHSLYADEYHWRCRFDQRFGKDATIPRPPPGRSYRQVYRYWSKQKFGECKKFKRSGERPAMNRLYAKVKQSLVNVGIKAGDLVEYDKDKMEGYIYDGADFYYQSTWLNEIIPGLRVIEDFPLLYWSRYFDSVAFDWRPYQETLVMNFEFIRLQNQFNTQCVYRTHFTHWAGVTYTLLILKNGSYGITKEAFEQYVNSKFPIECHLTTSKYTKYFKNIRNIPEDPNRILYLIINSAYQLG